MAEKSRSRQIEDDVVTIRAKLDYPHYDSRRPGGTPRVSYLAALEALDRLAALAHEAVRRG